MSALTITQIEARLRRVERLNRILVTFLCVTAGIAVLGATKGGPNVLTVDELRTPRLLLIDNTGKVVYSWHTAAGFVIEHGGSP